MEGNCRGRTVQIVEGALPNINHQYICLPLLETRFNLVSAQQETAHGQLDSYSFQVGTWKTSNSWPAKTLPPPSSAIPLPPWALCSLPSSLNLLSLVPEFPTTMKTFVFHQLAHHFPFSGTAVFPGCADLHSIRHLESKTKF